MQHDETAILSMAGGATRPGADRPEILIIEDNDTNALILRSMLRKMGYEAMVATDGISGVECACRAMPLLILMDLQMPRLDGFAAAERIRDADTDFRPVIVAVTASAGPEVHAACLTSGFDAVLSKPVMLDALGATLRRFMPAS